MKVVEVIRTNETDPVILQKGVKWVEEIGKVSVLCDDTPGTFCGELFFLEADSHTINWGSSSIAIIVVLILHFCLAFFIDWNRFHRESNFGTIIDASYGTCR